ncbi:hypothetical protein CEV31_2536 [Brucella thiophenivorans]|uniref:Uncharacterized protein n=1 Tax=Brucella thiophenivorans TaxID=571255 RepID=A0A256FWQ3_9HYPH|nr:hypothetical protein CEV31_2536 [Brucella thiophenivorans]
MHGLKAVAHVRQSSTHDNAHCVIEIGALHLLNNGNRFDTCRAARAAIHIFGTGWRR